MTDRMLASIRVGAALLALAGCTTSPIVGADCRAGLTVCDGRCVDLDSDPRHCGACGNACGAGQACHVGVCVAGLDGAVGDGAVGEAGAPDGSLDGGMPDGSWAVDGGGFDGALPDAAAYDGGEGGAPDGDGGLRDGAVGGEDGSVGDGGAPPGCGIGELRCGERCVRPDSDPMNCGACGVTCAADEVCAGGTCEWSCELPRQICDGLCVDTSRDPDHCGGCGIWCPSGVCMAGMCSGPLAGHLVLVGHDYASSRPDMNRVAGNAVMLARGNPVRVLVYEGDARSGSVAGVDAAIAQVASAIGRTWTRAVAADADAVPLELADADVFVLYAQTDAVDERLNDLGKAWGRALSEFLMTGGVVVVFDGMGANDGTHQILRAAGIFDAGRRADATLRVLDVVAPGDAVALGVPLRYRGEASTVRFATDAGVAVVADPLGPVVIHETVVP